MHFHKIVAFNVLSVVSVIHAFVLLIVSGFFARSYQFIVELDFKTCHKVVTAVYTLEIVLVILAIIEIGCAIWSSIVCCALGACCCNCNMDCCDSPSSNPAKVHDMSFANQQQPVILVDAAEFKPMNKMIQKSAVEFPPALKKNLPPIEID